MTKLVSVEPVDVNHPGDGDFVFFDPRDVVILKGEDGEAFAYGVRRTTLVIGVPADND